MEHDWTHHVRSSLGPALDTPCKDLHQASNRIGAYINGTAGPQLFHWAIEGCDESMVSCVSPLTVRPDHLEG
jgi:hypothetical protein